jgi:hypothetical protein
MTDPRDIINTPPRMALSINTTTQTGDNNPPTNQNTNNEHPESSNSRNQQNSPYKIPRSYLYFEHMIHDSLNAYNNSIIGKIITDKPIHISYIQNGLESI